MNCLDLDCLRALRTLGPCSNADVARRLKRPLMHTYRSIGRLVRAGLATHPKLQSWEITKLGVATIDRSLSEPNGASAGTIPEADGGD